MLLVLLEQGLEEADLSDRASCKRVEVVRQRISCGDRCECECGCCGSSKVHHPGV